MYTAATLAGCRMALVGTGRTISHFVSTNSHRNHSSALVGAPLLVPYAVFSQEECSLVKEPLQLQVH